MYLQLFKLNTVIKLCESTILGVRGRYVHEEVEGQSSSMSDDRCD